MMLPDVHRSREASYVSGQTVISILPVRSSISAAMNVRPSFVCSVRFPATSPATMQSRPDNSAFSSTIEHVSSEDSVKSVTQAVADRFGSITTLVNNAAPTVEVGSNIKPLTDVSNAAASGDKTALTDAATELQQAGLDFQEQLTQAAQSLSDAGIGVGGASGG